MRHIEPNKRKFITLILTENCNLACTYCYEHNKTKRSMSYELATNIIDQEMAKDDYSELVCFDFFGESLFLSLKKLRN